MKQVSKRVLSLVMVVAMLLGLLVPVSAVEPSNSRYQDLAFSKTNDASGVQSSALTPDGTSEGTDLNAPQYDADEIVRVSIVLEDASTMEKGFSMQSYSTNSEAIAYRRALKDEQYNVTAAIEQKLGQTLDVKWNLTLTANVISANVRYGQINDILRVSGVKDVVLETRYEPCVVQEETVSDPNMSTSSAQIGSNIAWAAGYTGAGSRVAIIDTGLDDDHESFAADGYEYSMSLRAAELGMTLAEYMQSMNVLTVDEIADVMDELNARTKNYSPNAKAEEFYKTSKVPFAYNYIDLDLDYYSHDLDTQSGHGSHVAGIAAANAWISDGGDGFVKALDQTGVQGVAPDAQIIVMKVFGKYGGAYDSDYMAAIEDAIVLGCDSVNLSLGSAAPGFITNSTYQKILDKLTESDTVVVMSAGNSYGWAEAAKHGQAGYLYADDVSMNTVGSPGSYTNSLAIASVNNTGAFGNYFSAQGVDVIYNETDYSNEPMTSIAGDYEYIFIDGIGTEEDFAALDGALEGKVAFCFRGTTSFFQKAENAVKYGAIATVVCNNQSGTLNMDLTDYKHTEPVVSIMLSEANAIREASTPVTDENGNVLYYTGEITISAVPGSVISDGEYYTISDFSSWGVPGSLTLKPEIITPGGNIYSVDGETKGGKAYVSMSGTSMAAPQAAGMAAVVAQYVKENGLESRTDLTLRGLAQSLLMSTAVPMYEAEGRYFPVLRQGAGLANIGAAVEARSYVVMGEDATQSWADGKVKAELGEDAEREGVYSFSFTLHNLTDEEQTYEVYADLFTQALFTNGGYTYMDKATTMLQAIATWTADGQTVEPVDGIELYDFNADGKIDINDVLLVLDYAVDNSVVLNGPEYADLNGDGTIGTYDAYLLLQKINSAYVYLPAGGEVEVSVSLALTEAQKEALEQDPCGAYIEGFVYTRETATDEGVVGTTHSIPVLGYYGSWTEPSMYDKGSFIDRLYGDTTPTYVSGRVENYLTLKRADNAAVYTHTGNPYVVEDSNPVDRYAMNPNAQFYQMHFATIRNAGAYTFVAQDESGKVVYMYAPSANLSGAYYHVNGQSWQNLGWISTFNVSPARMGFQEGDMVTMSAVMIPEYYAQEGALNSDRVKYLVENDLLGDGAYQSYTFELDATAPEALHIYQDLQNGDIVVECKDNNYVAVVQVQTLNGRVLAEAIPEKAERGQSSFARIDMSDVKVGTEAIILVGDYAMNESAYVVEINGEPIDYTGQIFGFTESSYRGGGQRWVNIIPENLWYYDNNTYDGIENMQMVDMSVLAAEYLDGFVYMAADDGYFYVAQHDMWLDAIRASRWDETISGVNDMAFDYKTKTMYLLDNNNTIYELDINTTELTKIGSITMAPNRMNDSDYSRRIISMTIDDDSNFYIANWGGDTMTYLHTFTLDDFVDGKITNLEPISHGRDEVIGCAMGAGSMAYDYDNDVIYATGDILGGGAHGSMAVINPKTGIGQKVTTEDGGYGASYASGTHLNIVGLYLVPSQQANAIEMTDTPSKIELDRETLHGLIGMEIALTSYVTNWNVRDKSVTWTSSDSSVATVSTAGRVEMVGVGEATITATTNAEPHLSASCVVTVEETPAVDLTAMLVDGNGDSHWIDFNTADAENFTVVADAEKQFYSGTENNDNIYVHDGTRIYGINADTFETTELNGVSTDWRWSDAAPAPKTSRGFGQIVTVSAQGTYLVLLEPETGLIPKAFDMRSYLGGEKMAVIAHKETGTTWNSVWKEQMESNTYYVITDNGVLMEVVIYVHEHRQFGAAYEVSSKVLAELDLPLNGVSTVVGNSQASMVYDAESGYLFLAAYSGGDSSKLYAINPVDCVALEIDDFGASNWPVVSLYSFQRATDLTVRILTKNCTIFVDAYTTMRAKVVLAESDDSVTWTSSDPSIATVDADGRVKGISAGTVTITATTVETNDNGEHVSASTTLTVKPLTKVDATVNAQIVTDDGVKLITIDASTGDWTTIGACETVLDAAGGHDGEVVGINAAKQLVTIDPETLKETVHGTFDEGTIIRDFATMPKNVMDVSDYWTYDHYDGEPFGFPLALMEDNIISMVPDYEHVTEKDRKYMFWDAGIWSIDNTMATVSFIGHTFYDEGHAGILEAKLYYSVGSDGRLREYIIAPMWYDYYYEPGEYTYALTVHTLGNIGVTFEDPYGMTSTYIKNETCEGLMLADTNSDGVELYWVDLSAGTDYQAKKICTIEGATAISGLYTQDDLNGTLLNDDYKNLWGTIDDDAPLTPYFANETLEPITAIAGLRNEDGTVAVESKIITTKTAPVEETADVEDAPITIVAEAETTNGLYVVEYDSSKVTLESYTTNAQLKSIREEDGKLVFGFVNETPAAAGTVLATLNFQRIEGVAYAEVTVTTAEYNDTLPNSTELFPLGKEEEPVDPVDPPVDPVDPPVDPVDPVEPEPKPCPSEIYSDIAATAWYHEAVDFVTDAGLMNGMGNGKFEPNGTVTRAMVATVLWRLSGSPEVENAATFTDVVAGAWYADAVAWAEAEGIINGMSATTFEPLAPATREQIAVMLWRMAGEPETEATELDFADSNKIDTWAIEAMRYVVESGLFVGDDAGKLNPLANITRAELATILMRLEEGSFKCELNP